MFKLMNCLHFNANINEKFLNVLINLIVTKFVRIKILKFEMLEDFLFD